MKHELEFRGFEPTRKIQNPIESNIERLERKVQGLSQNPIVLRCAMEEVTIYKLFRVSLTLDVPQRKLVSKEETHDAELAAPGQTARNCR